MKKKAKSGSKKQRNQPGSIGAFNKMMKPTANLGPRYQPVIPVKKTTQRQRGA